MPGNQMQDEYPRATQCSMDFCTKEPVQLVRYQDAEEDLYWCEHHQDSDATDGYEWPKQLATW